MMAEEDGEVKREAVEAGAGGAGGAGGEGYFLVRIQGGAPLWDRASAPVR